MFSMYVFYICFPYMFFKICFLYMFSIHVFYICFLHVMLYIIKGKRFYNTVYTYIRFHKKKRYLALLM